MFLWVHLYDPHAPYAGSYDREVTFADSHTGRLLQELRSRGHDPVVIVAGDHGESLGEHGEATHGMLLYDATLRVPLVVAGPGIAASKRDDPVSLIDIAPTLAALAGLPKQSDRSSTSLLGPPAPDREIYAEAQYPRVAGWSPVHSLVQDRWKVIASNGAELYDLSTDGGERQNVAPQRDALVRAMRRRVDALSTSNTAAASRATPSDVAERLRALGYVAGNTAPPKPGEGPNPAEHIGAWNEFEVALSEMSRPGSQAASRLRRLVEAHPDAPVFVSTYARAVSERGSPREALTISRRAVAKWPGDAMLFHELAVAARDAGARDEAMKAEQAAVAIQPVFPAAHNGVGLLLTDANRHAEAAQAFASAVKGDPTNAEYWVNLGNAQRASGNSSQAESAYRRAADIDPRSADAINGLGVLLVQQQRATEAIPMFERAIAAAPDLVEPRLNLGIAYQESGQRDRAVAAYREVLARAKPGSPERRAASDLLQSLTR
jgi:tetratricopeptide (TPR) repeat protein